MVADMLKYDVICYMPPPISIIYQVNNRPKSQQDAFIARLLDKNLDLSLYFIRKRVLYVQTRFSNPCLFYSNYVDHPRCVVSTSVVSCTFK